LDARSEFEISQRSLKGGGEAGREHHCTALSHPNNRILKDILIYLPLMVN